jgi:hypothetical protein
MGSDGALNDAPEGGPFAHGNPFCAVLQPGAGYALLSLPLALTLANSTDLTAGGAPARRYNL